METQLKVSLIQYTPEPEKTVAAAAKLCYSQVGIQEITDKLDKESTEKFLHMIMGLGHLSTIEHVSFTFAIEGVSRALTHQLVRHRVASYSQQSQRYVKEDAFDYVIPPAIKEDPKCHEQFLKSMERLQQDYETIRDQLTANHTQRLMKENGLDEKSARSKALKLANEDARFVLPNACETKIMVTMNARELLHFFNHRCCNRAQWEIRTMADEMLRLAKQAAPIIFENAGPSCVTGPCPEGNMCCGQTNAVRKKYKELNK